MQERYQTTLEEWKSPHLIQEKQGSWLKDGHLVIPPDEELRHQILQILHDALTMGHPSRDKTFTQVPHAYWWPRMQTWITDYIAACTVGQQNKNVTVTIWHTDARVIFFFSDLSFSLTHCYRLPSPLPHASAFRYYLLIISVPY